MLLLLHLMRLKSLKFLNQTNVTKLLTFSQIKHLSLKIKNKANLQLIKYIIFF